MRYSNDHWNYISHCLLACITHIESRIRKYSQCYLPILTKTRLIFIILALSIACSKSILQCIPLLTLYLLDIQQPIIMLACTVLQHTVRKQYILYYLCALIYAISSSVLMAKLTISTRILQQYPTPIFILQGQTVLYRNQRAIVFPYSNIIDFLQCALSDKSTLIEIYNSVLSHNTIGYTTQHLAHHSSQYFTITFTIVARFQVLIAVEDCPYYGQCLKQKDDSDSKDVMMASCAHEIRNSLQSFATYIELANSATSSTQFKGFYQNLVCAKENLFNIVKDLLDLSLIRKGIIQINISPVDIYDVVNGIVSIYKQPCLTKGIKLTTHIDTTLPSCIRTDKVRLSQIIVNLLTNAIKFTQHGRIIISMAAHKQQKILLSVTDTGIGIKPSDQGKLFTAFSKLKQENNTNPSGVGLGLMISMKLSLLLGDGITFSSTYQQGSTFNVILNTGMSQEEYESSIKIVDAIDINSTSESNLTDNILNKVPSLIPRVSLQSISNSLIRFSTSKMDLLKDKCICSDAIAIDDNIVNLIALKKMAECDGLSLKYFTDPRDAVVFMGNCISCHECNGFKCKIAFVDLNMPIMNGLECMKKLKLLENDRQYIRIVALTGDLMCIEREKEVLLEEGFSDVLTKPISKKTLVDQIKGRHSRRSLSQIQ